MPASVTLCVTDVDVPGRLIPELSVTTSDAVSLPAAEGLKPTETVQLAFAASVVPQALESTNTAALLPARVIELIVSGALPVLFSVAVCVAELVFAVAVKVSVDGVSDATGVPLTVPVRATVCVVDAELSVAVSVAL